MLGSVKKYELWVLGALLLLGFALWLRRRFKNARLAKKIYEDEQVQKAEHAEHAKTNKPTTPVE